MRVFLTGATGFIGSNLVPELTGAGHDVVGLARSEASAARLLAAGVEVVRGDVNDAAALRAGVARADAAIHAAFEHDFADLARLSEADRRVVATLGEALAGRPFIVTSGTGLVRAKGGRPAAETDAHATSAEHPRAATEEAADALIAAGGHVVVLRLSQVHDVRRFGRISEHVAIARRTGRVAYVGDGAMRVPAVHVSDAVRLYRLALERGEPGARYHAVAEEGVPLREVAETIGARLGLPATSIAPDEAEAAFGPLARLAVLDLAASSALTRERLGWTCDGPGLLDDLRQMPPT